MGNEEVEEEEVLTPWENFRKKVVQFVEHNYFLIAAVLVIIISAVYPDLGRNGGPLRTEYSISYGATCTVFLVAGVTLKTNALVEALGEFKLNAFIQGHIFVIVPCIFYALSLALRSTLNDALVDGVLMLGCLPCTINMCIVMTTSSGGNTAEALFNATLANILGIFITPAYVFSTLGVSGDVKFTDVIASLSLKVILPTAAGQILQNLPFDAVRNAIINFKPYCKRTQENCLVLVVYASFSTTFYNGVKVSPGDIFAVLGLMTITQAFIYAGTWYASGLSCLGFGIKSRIPAMFCSTHKTMAMGIPLISSMYEGDKNIGLYTIPLLLYHPAQIIFGAYFSPRILQLVEKEEREKEGKDN